MQRVPSVPRHRQPQRGVALYVVLVFVMLSMLLALWASRTSLFNEMVVGNDADYQRASEAAQSLLLDAEMDIRGEKANGGYCSSPPTPPPTGSDPCRASTAAKIPLQTADLTTLLNTLAAQAPTQCLDGLCVKRTLAQDFWNNTDTTKGLTLAQMETHGVGARYGQYTGAQQGNYTTAPANPILYWTATDPATQGGWYWIEVLPYIESQGQSLIVQTAGGNTPTKLQLTLIPPNVVYRITALAYGRKPGTMVVLQETYAPQKRMD